MRRGILLSIMTIFLLFAVFLLSLAVFQNQSSSELRQATLSLPTKIASIEHFVGQDVLWMLNISAPDSEKNLSASTLTIKFANLGSIPLQNLSNITDQYASFIKNNYSYFERLNISLINFTTNITLSGYNATISFGQNQTVIFFTQPELLRSLSIMLLTNGTKMWNNTAPSPDPSYQNINVSVLNSSGSLVFNSMRSLSPNETNSAFSVFFNQSGLPHLHVEYGFALGQSGTLKITTYGLRISPQDLKMTFSLIPGENQIKLDTVLSISGASISRNDTVTLRRV